MKKLSAVCFSIILAAMLVGVGMGQRPNSAPHHIRAILNKNKIAYLSAVPVCLVAEVKVAKVEIRPDGSLDLTMGIDIDEYQNPPVDFACSTLMEK